MARHKNASVAVVDDHPLIRRGFASVLSDEMGLMVVWTAATIADAIENLMTSQPELMVIGLALSDGSGLDLIRKIGKDYPKIKILVSSMQDEQLYAGRCLKAGAKGFISKSESTETLIDAIHLVANDRVYLSEAMTARMLHDVGGKNDSEGVDRLSDRELQVLESIGKGMDTKRIAMDMHISPKTVDSFRERIKTKLNLSNSTELVHFAVSRLV